MKKLLFLVASTCLFFSSSLSADYRDYDSCDGGSNSTCCGWFGNSLLSLCNNWCVDVDYLYWSPRRCDLDYAVPINADVSEFADGDLFEVDPDYTSGFRIELTKCFCDWDFGVRYTRLHTHDTDTAQDVPGGVAPTRLTGAIQALGMDTPTEANARYNVDLDVIDFEIGCQYQPFCKTVCRIYGGAKLAYIDQRLLAHYIYSTGFNLINRYRGSVRMDAYGMYIGTKGNRCLCRLFDCVAFELFGDFSLGGLVGTFDRGAVIDGLEGVTPGPAGVGFEPTFTAMNVADSCERLVWNGNITFGLNFELEREMCWCTRWHLSVGYEMHYWTNMSDFTTLITEQDSRQKTLERNTDSIGFDGFFLNVGVCF